MSAAVNYSNFGHDYSNCVILREIKMPRIDNIIFR